MVDNSYLGSSDEVGFHNTDHNTVPEMFPVMAKLIRHVVLQVSRLMERVEHTFIKHFSNGNRSKGMRILRPKAKREQHRVTFFMGKFLLPSTYL